MRSNHAVDYGPLQVQTCVKPDGGQYRLILASEVLVTTVLNLGAMNGQIGYQYHYRTGK